MKIFTKLKKSAFAGIIAAVMVAVPMTAFAGFYPDRQTYTCVTPTNCPGADHVVFDSFVNNPVVGDERPFFAGSLNGANVQDRIKVSDGQEVVLRAYVHNNADPNKIGVNAATAHNVKMKVLIPTAKQTDQNLVSFISASNANPGTINDTMSLYGDGAFTLEYVAGSASFAHRADGVNMISEHLNDTIVGGGTYLGDIHGCFDYSGYVTLKVKVHMPSTPPVTPSYKCDLLDITANKDRKVTISKFSTTATNGAVFKNAVIDWGDNSSQLTIANPVGQTHQYAQDGTYIVSAVAHFTVNGEDVTSNGPACQKQVTFTPNQPPHVVPPNTPPTSTPPTELVNTGAGSIAGLFTAAVIAGIVGFRVYLGRRLSRQ